MLPATAWDVMFSLTVGDSWTDEVESMLAVGLPGVTVVARRPPRFHCSWGDGGWWLCEGEQHVVVVTSLGVLQGYKLRIRLFASRETNYDPAVARIEARKIDGVGGLKGWEHLPTAEDIASTAKYLARSLLYKYKKPGAGGGRA